MCHSLMTCRFHWAGSTIPFAMFVIVGAGNAVNLTDGLDGLATMPVAIASATFPGAGLYVG